MYVCPVAESCPTLCNPMDCKLPGSLVHGIFWIELPSPSPGDLTDPGVKPGSPESPRLTDGFFQLCYLGSPLIINRLIKL